MAHGGLVDHRDAMKRRSRRVDPLAGAAFILTLSFANAYLLQPAIRQQERIILDRGFLEFFAAGEIFSEPGPKVGDQC